jgi:hypothetical protein
MDAHPLDSCRYCGHVREAHKPECEHCVKRPESDDRCPFFVETIDVAALIQSAFADEPVGAFLRVAEIRQRTNLGAGAISARLFPIAGDCTIQGIRGGVGGPAHTKGAYKIEEFL